MDNDNTPKAPKKSMAGIIILELIDLALLVVIVLSLIQKPDTDVSKAKSHKKGSKSNTESYKDSDDDYDADYDDDYDDVEFHDYRYDDEPGMSENSDGRGTADVTANDGRGTADGTANDGRGTADVTANDGRGTADGTANDGRGTADGTTNDGRGTGATEDGATADRSRTGAAGAYDTEGKGAAGAYDTEGIDGIEDIDDMSAADLSTTDRPSLSDFMWYFDGVYYNGTPSNAKFIQDPELLKGDWKGFIWYDPDRKVNSYGIEFLNVNLNIGDRNTKVTFDLYELHFENTEVINEEDQNNLVFNGQWEGGTIYATGPGNVHIDCFYTTGNGKQYAVGSIDSPDGTPTFFAMVRP